jgi:hypothetical protein
VPVAGTTRPGLGSPIRNCSASRKGDGTGPRYRPTRPTTPPRFERTPEHSGTNCRTSHRRSTPERIGYVTPLEQLRLREDLAGVLAPLAPGVPHLVDVRRHLTGFHGRWRRPTADGSSCSTRPRYRSPGIATAAARSPAQGHRLNTSDGRCRGEPLPGDRHGGLGERPGETDLEQPGTAPQADPTKHHRVSSTRVVAGNRWGRKDLMRKRSVFLRDLNPMAGRSLEMTMCE